MPRIDRDMATVGDKFYASWKEAVMIGGIAAAMVYFGAERVIAQGVNATGLFGALGPALGSSLVVGGTVFASDMAYELFLRGMY